MSKVYIYSGEGTYMATENEIWHSPKMCDRHQFICFILLLILQFNWFLNSKDKLAANFHRINSLNIISIQFYLYSYCNYLYKKLFYGQSYLLRT